MTVRKINEPCPCGANPFECCVSGGMRLPNNMRHWSEEPVILELVRCEPNPEVVQKLRELLVLAEAGKLRGFALLTNEPREGVTGYTAAGEWSGSLAMWACETFKHRWLHEWQDGLR